jgi:hypothetical protein
MEGKETNTLIRVMIPSEITYAFKTPNDSIELLTFVVPDITNDSSYIHREWELSERKHTSIQEYNGMYKRNPNFLKDSIDKIVIPIGNTDFFDSKRNRFIFDKRNYDTIKGYNSQKINSREALEEAQERDSISQYKVI